MKEFVIAIHTKFSREMLRNYQNIQHFRVKFVIQICTQNIYVDYFVHYFKDHYFESVSTFFRALWLMLEGGLMKFLAKGATEKIVEDAGEKRYINLE